jgi:hypothetical protein
MSNFSCNAMLTVQQLAICHKTTSQPGAERDDDKVLHAFGGAIHHLTNSRGICIIGDNCGYLELFFEHVRQWDDAFPGQIGGPFNGTFIIISVCCAHTDTKYLMLAF